MKRFAFIIVLLIGFSATLRPAATDLGMSKFSVRHVSIPLTAAQINGMYAAPVKILDPQGAGKTIIVTKAAIRITRSATGFASGGAVIAQYGSTVNGGGTQALDSTFASTLFTGAAGVSESIRNGAVLSDQGTALQNAGIYLSNATGAFTTGTGAAVVDLWYYVF